MKLNKLFSALSLTLIISGTIFFSSSCSEKEPSNAFIWKTDINGSTFYLAGSIHSAKETDYPLPDIYIDSYNDAMVLILELQRDFKGIEEDIMRYAQKDTLSQEDYLDKYLDSNTIKKLEDIIEKDRLDNYMKHEGWLLNMTIEGMKSKLVGYDPLLAIDKYFHDMATKDEKEIIGLDSIETQIALFEFDAPLAMQVQIIENAVNNMQSKAEGELPLFDAYFDYDIDLFNETFISGFDLDNPQVKHAYDMVFTSRNKNWVKSFEELAAESPSTYFVLVGAGHYFGPNNILQLLEEKGYTVEKI